MRCELCGLPDLHRGMGDGIGSCECPRCECCGAGPFECECGRDWEDYYDDEPDEPVDYLCNDRACGRRQLRLSRKTDELIAKAKEVDHG